MNLCDQLNISFIKIRFSCNQNGFEAKSLHTQIPPQEKASCKLPPEENSSQQNASTLKYLPVKHL